MAEITIALSLGSAAVTAIAFAAGIYYAYQAGDKAGVTREALRHATLDLEAITEQRENVRDAHEDLQEDLQRIASDDVDADVDSLWGEDDSQAHPVASVTLGPDAPEAIDLQTS